MNITHFSGSLYRAVVPLSVILLAACGGDGGGDPAGGDPGGKVEITCGTTDLDGDGLPDCYEKFLGTSLVDADTDGDKLDDFVEVVTLGFDPSNNVLKFNPLIADVPRLSFEFTSIPKIDVNYQLSDGSTVSEALGSTTGFTSGQSSSTTDTHTTSIETSISSEASLMGASVSASVTLKNEYSFSYTKEQSSENRQDYSKLNETTNTEGVTYDSGSISITLKITNAGNQTIHLKDLSLSAVLVDPADPDSFIPIGTLVYGDGFPVDGLAIEPQASTVGTLTFTGSIGLNEAMALLRDSSGLIITPAAWNILDGVGDIARDFKDAATAIGAKDATILVDYGPRSGRAIERYRVATTAAGNQEGITITQAMETYLSNPNASEPLLKFGTADWDFDGTLGPTHNGIIGIRDVSTNVVENGHWFVLYNRPDPNGAAGETITETFDNTKEAYDLTGVALKGGHVIEFIYLQDNDRDGAGARTEKRYGTSDDIVDTDGDGLTDFEEIQDGTTHPQFVDFDNDGLTDPQELAAGTNPRVADSDNDGDGLIYTQEILLGTEPLNADSDNDTISDLCDAMPTTPLAPDSAEYTDNLILCLAMDELTEIVGEVTTVVTNDDSGLKFRETTEVSQLVTALGGPMLTASHNRYANKAIYFDGVDDVLETDLLPRDFIGTTVSVWFKPTLASRQDNRLQTILMSEVNWNAGFHPNISWDNNQISIVLFDAECGFDFNYLWTLDPISGADLNQWNHVLVTIGSSMGNGNLDVVNVYLNGSLLIDNAMNASACVLEFGNSWRIGGVFDTAPAEYGAFQGAIDDVRIYNRPLSADEATEMYETGHIVTPVPN